MNGDQQKHSKVKITYEGDEVYQTDVGKIVEAICSLPGLRDALNSILTTGPTYQGPPQTFLRIHSPALDSIGESLKKIEGHMTIIAGAAVSYDERTAEKEKIEVEES